MEWRLIETRQLSQTASGIIHWTTLVGWQCQTPKCGNTRWQVQRPSDQCELCSPEV